MTPESQPEWPAWILQMAKHHTKATFYRYKNLSLLGKLCVCGLLLFYVALGTVLVLIGGDRIGQSMYDISHKISGMRFGWMILVAAIFLVCFPPCIGHTTLVTLCGFAYGMKGFFLAAGASLAGSALAFVVLRFLFSRRLRQWSHSSEKWRALEAVVQAKGLLLIMLIRLSPFPPWVYSNTLFASIEAVALWQFVVATFVVFPKLALHVFIGTRLASLSDGQQRKHMDTSLKIMNICAVVGGILVSIVASWVIYRSMTTYIRDLEGFSPEVDEAAAEAIEEADEGAPLLRDVSNESLHDLEE